MTETMKTLLAVLPRTLQERRTEEEVTTFVEVWERHVSLCTRVAERLILDFGLTDLAQVIDRHMELFLLVDRASKITGTALPAAVLTVQQAIAGEVEDAESAEELVLLLRASPQIAGELQTAVREQTKTLSEPLVLALGLVADDKQGLRNLLDVFTPDAASSGTDSRS